MSNKTITFFVISISLAVCCASASLAQSEAFTQRLDLQTRIDDRSSRDVRYQYRVRHYAQYKFDGLWSVNTFAVTGDDFGSSHNTLDDGAADYFYLRRLYLRRETANGKTEIGIIPTYKGRVSSSGLSKDGWIKGLRQVSNLRNGRIEFVLGQLKSVNAKSALDLPNKADYFELEYSGKISEKWSFEVSAERMTESNFLRSELRHQWSDNSVLFAEIVTKVDSGRLKTVTGAEGEWTISNYPVEYFAHFSYVSDGFGPRAELTEDFLGTGPGFSGELSGILLPSIFGEQTNWFVRYDGIEDRTRLLAGLSWSWR